MSVGRWFWTKPDVTTAAIRRHRTGCTQDTPPSGGTATGSERRCERGRPRGPTARRHHPPAARSTPPMTILYGTARLSGPPLARMLQHHSHRAGTTTAPQMLRARARHLTSTSRTSKGVHHTYVMSSHPSPRPDHGHLGTVSFVRGPRPGDTRSRRVGWCHQPFRADGRCSQSCCVHRADCRSSQPRKGLATTSQATSVREISPEWRRSIPRTPRGGGTPARTTAPRRQSPSLHIVVGGRGVSGSDLFRRGKGRP